MVTAYFLFGLLIYNRDCVASLLVSGEVYAAEGLLVLKLDRSQPLGCDSLGGLRTTESLVRVFNFSDGLQ